MNGLFFFVTRVAPRQISPRYADVLIVGGGIVLPTVMLAVLLSYGLSIMPDARAATDGLRVRVIGEQWWWRVEYLPEGGGAPIVSANEMRLPAGRRTEILLQSDTVIHSFWVPRSAARWTCSRGARPGCRWSRPSPASIAANAPSSAARAMR